MKKIGIFLFLMTLAIGLVVSNIFSFGRVSGDFFNFSFNFKGVKGSGVMTTEKRDLSDFNAVDVGGIFQVEITTQKDFGVEIEADDNLTGYIKTEVRNGVLRIRTEKKISTRNAIRVRISAPAIDRLEVSGAAKVNVVDLKESELTIDSSGASKVTATGEAAKLIVDVSGASKIDAGGLQAASAVVDASGASHVSVNVTGELRSDASGASKVTYSGTPANLVTKTSGAAKVSAK